MGGRGVRRLGGASGERGLHHGRPEQGGQQEAGESGRREREPREPAPARSPHRSAPGDGCGARRSGVGGTVWISVRHGGGGCVGGRRPARGPPGRGRRRGTGGGGGGGGGSRGPWGGGGAGPRPRG